MPEIWHLLDEDLLYSKVGTGFFFFKNTQLLGRHFRIFANKNGMWWATTWKSVNYIPKTISEHFSICITINTLGWILNWAELSIAMTAGKFQTTLISKLYLLVLFISSHRATFSNYRTLHRQLKFLIFHKQERRHKKWNRQEAANILYNDVTLYPNNEKVQYYCFGQQLHGLSSFSLWC